MLIRSLLVLCALLAIASEAARAARTDPLDPLTARARRLDSYAGLSQDSALAMAQDRHGWIWIGTQDGLNRFDGYEVKTYRARAGQAGSLGASGISALKVDARGDLWVGTGRGLFRFIERDDAFERIPLTAEANPQARHFVYALYPAAEGQLWIGSDAGLTRLVYAADGQFDRQHWPLPGPDGEPTAIRAIAIDAEGRYWLGTPQGLREFDPQTGVATAVAAERLSTPINGLLALPGQLWLATDQAGLIRYRAADQDWRVFDRHSQPALDHERVHALFFSREGALWVGGETAAYRIPDPAAASPILHRYGHRPHDPHSLGQGRVPSFLQDRDGTLWIGSWEGGAARLSPRFNRFLSFNGETAATEAIGDSRILALQAEGDQLWLGSSRGVFRFDSSALQLQAIAGLETLNVFSLALAEGHLWIGSGNGLWRYGLDTGQLEPAGLPAALSAARIRRLWMDGERLWLFAELHGLYVFNRADMRLLAAHRFPGNVYNLNPLDAQTVLISASDGLHVFSRDGQQRQRTFPANQAATADGLPAPTTGVLRDSRGRIWLPSYGGGLLELRLGAEGLAGPVEIISATAGLGLANDGINSALADGQGRLWLATDRGISLFDPERGDLHNFDASDGVLARGYYFSAATRVGDGLLAFGSKSGFTLVDPDSDTAAELPPAPLLTAVEAGGQALLPRAQDPRSPLPVPAHLLDRLQLPPGGGRSLGFRFAAPDPTGADKLRYQYRLEGFDPEWISTDADNRLARYTNLDPGAYRLHLRSLGEKGQLSDERLLEVDIAPFWWQSGWARGIAFALFALTAVAIYRWRIGQLQQAAQQMEQLVKERTQALSNAKRHAEATLVQLQTTQQELVRSEKLSALGQLVAGVAHEVNTPLGVALTASSHLAESIQTLRRQVETGKIGRNEFQRFVNEADEGTAMIGRNLERAADLIRNFKQVSVDRSSDGRRRFALEPFLNELTQSLKLLWRGRAIELQVSCPPELALDSFPGALGQVLTNLAQNAVQHAFAADSVGRMQIEVQSADGEQIELRFSDNGRGIDARELGRIFEPFYTTARAQGGTGLGLHIVHNLVREKLGGQIRVHSEVGVGTDFILSLPRIAPELG